MKLSEIVKDYRKRMQISQRTFAHRCNLSNTYISFIENDMNPRTGEPIVPTLENYQKIANAMDLTVHQLFQLLDEDSPVDLRIHAPEESDDPLSPELRDFLIDLNQLTPSQLQQAKAVLHAMFAGTNPDLFT